MSRPVHVGRAGFHRTDAGGTQDGVVVCTPGRVEDGAIVDLLLIDGTPLTDIELLAAPKPT